jgi:hypothetical protein
MSRNWQRIIDASMEASAEAIPPDEAARMAPVLDGLEAAFRPLAATLDLECDLALLFRADAEPDE